MKPTDSTTVLDEAPEASARVLESSMNKTGETVQKRLESALEVKLDWLVSLMNDTRDPVKLAEQLSLADQVLSLLSRMKRGQH